MATVPLEDLLRLTLEEGASDLHLAVDTPPSLRLNGRIVRMDVPPLSAEDAEGLIRAAASDYHLQKLAEEGTVDFAISFRDTARFRVSIFRQRGLPGMVVRLIPKALMTLEEIGLPLSVKSLLTLPRGLILVTGPTGSGKSTTLASMVDIINSTQPAHIITIEDPIEYFHPHKESIVTQREVGTDVPAFGEALRRALRQDPDVILVGEMRDRETMEAAITAAETGHLVFSTLHTTGAARTVDRIIDSFPSEHQEQIRVQLAGNLKAVISQLLLPKANDSGRVAAFEVMIMTHSIATLIRENKTFRIPNDILTGSKFGMVSLDECLAGLYRRGIITYDEVMSKAQDPQGAAELVRGHGRDS